MPIASHRNVLLLAALGTRPSHLIDILDGHPEISAPPAFRLTALFHTASRDILRAAKREGAWRPDSGDASDPISYARGTCTAALTALFDEVRERTGARVVVLWDPDRMTFPFSDVCDVDVLLLHPGSHVRTLAGVPGAYARHVADLVERDVESLLHRVRVWGVDDGRILQVEEDAEDAQASYCGLLEFLGADASPEAVEALFARRVERLSGAD